MMPSGPADSAHTAGSSGGKRVDDLHARLLEVRAVASGHDQAMDEGGGRNEAVLDRHGTAGGAKMGEQLRPTCPVFFGPPEA